MVMVMSNSLEGQFYSNGDVQLFWKDSFKVMVMSNSSGRTILL